MSIQQSDLTHNLNLVITDFADDDDLSGYFILVPDEESDEKILHALGF